MFEEPFWIGLFELIDEEGLHVCKVTFGSEPTDAQIFEFIEREFRNLVYSKPISIEQKTIKSNPKRMIRLARKQMNSKEIGTKSQQALKLQHEEGKLERKKKTKEEKLQQKQMRFKLSQEKRLNKHKGH